MLDLSHYREFDISVCQIPTIAPYKPEGGWCGYTLIDTLIVFSVWRMTRQGWRGRVCFLFDFCKVLDSLENHILLKLFLLNDDTAVLRWFQNYNLSLLATYLGHRQLLRVRIMSRGVPQGIALGLALYCLVYVNYLPSHVSGDIQL